jgi:hypothetical protein
MSKEEIIQKGKCLKYRIARQNEFICYFEVDETQWLKSCILTLEEFKLLDISNAKKCI